VTTQFIRTPTERAQGTAAMQASRRLAGLLGHGLLRLTVTGREYLPAGGALLAVNHASYVDGPLVFGVRHAATRPSTPLPATPPPTAADPEGPDR
jgi:hypothetical protein